jgi:hypothetical protein
LFGPNEEHAEAVQQHLMGPPRDNGVATTPMAWVDLSSIRTGKNYFVLMSIRYHDKEAWRGCAK